MTNNDNNSPCVTSEDKASMQAAIDTLTAERDEWKSIAGAQSRRATVEIDRLKARNHALELAIIQLTLKLSAFEHIHQVEENIRDIEAAGNDTEGDYDDDIGTLGTSSFRASPSINPPF